MKIEDDATTAKDAAPTNEDPVESFRERMQHMWGVKILGRTTVCSKCGAAQIEDNRDNTCDVAAGERAGVQLTGCLFAAEGNADKINNTEEGDYGWSPAFQAVKDLRAERDKLNEAGADFRRIIEQQRKQNQAHGRNIARLITDKVSLQRELREMLNQPESDEPASVEEPEIKTVVLDAGPDHLKIVEIANVTALRAERDQLRKAIAGLREKVLAHLPCVCSQNRSVCHRHEIEETLDDFYRRAGVGEAKGPERDDDLTTAAEPCDPERIKDKLVIRFDSLPGPEPAGFVETELNGKGVNAGEWVQDEEYWLLVIDDYDPKVIADLRRENSRLKTRARDFRDELASRAMQGMIASKDYLGENARKRILAFHAYLYADEMLKQR